MESYDPFIRNYSASLANKSLERLYNLLLVDDIYSKLIKDAMNNRNMNYLRFDDKVNMGIMMLVIMILVCI